MEQSKQAWYDGTMVAQGAAAHKASQGVCVRTIAMAARGRCVETEAEALEVAVAVLIADQHVVWLPIFGTHRFELDPPAVLHAHLSHLLR